MLHHRDRRRETMADASSCRRRHLAAAHRISVEIGPTHDAAASLRQSTAAISEVADIVVGTVLGLSPVDGRAEWRPSRCGYNGEMSGRWS